MPTYNPSLELLPATRDLVGAEVELVDEPNRERLLKRALDSVRDDFDWILIDCAPSLGLLTVNALTAADWLLIPIQAEFYALESMGQLLDTLNKVQTAVNPKLRLLGITMTMVQGGSNLGRMVADAAKRHFGGRILETHIPRSVAVAEAPLEGAPVALSKSPIERHPGSLAYWNLAKEVSSRLEIIRTQRSV